MSDAPAQKNLIQKAAAVMAQVEHVPKNGWNDFHKYHYATEADITTCVRAAMAEQGLMLIPTVDKVDWTKISGPKGEDRLATLTVKFTLTDGVESREFIILGEGQDRGDKATYKAMTGALKYALLKLFLIPTGDDPEKEEGDRPEQQRPPMQRPPVPQRPQQAAPPPKPAAHHPETGDIAKRQMAMAKRIKDTGLGFAEFVKNTLGEAKASNQWSEDDLKQLDQGLKAESDVP